MAAHDLQSANRTHGGAYVPEWLREHYPFEPRRFDTGRGMMSYLDEGRGDEAVLMVHGNPTWSFFYRQLVLALRGNCRCIVPDHLGCGLSDKPQDFNYTLGEHIKNLDALVASLGLRKVHLIVHDWGGPIGLGTMLPRSSVLGSVVIFNTAAFQDSRVPWRIRLCRVPGLGALVVRGGNGFAWPATWMAVKRPMPPAIRRAFVWPYDSWANRIATHRFVVDIPGSAKDPSGAVLAGVERALPELRKHPVRIIWGGGDFCFDRHYYDRWRQLLPEATATYLGQAGHYLLEDAGQEVVSLVREHLVNHK